MTNVSIAVKIKFQYLRIIRLTVRTLPFQGGNKGSIPLWSTSLSTNQERFKMQYIVKSMGHVVYLQTSIREKKKNETQKQADYSAAGFAKKVKREAEEVFKEVDRGAELWEVQADGSAKRIK